MFIWSAVTISLATGIMVFTPGPNALIPGWLFLMFFRVFVGIGNAGIFTIDLPLVQEFVPAHKRGWVSALITTLLPGGGMLAGSDRLVAAADHRLALPVPGRPVAARAGAHDPLLGAGIAALADPHGARIEEARQVARLGADDRPEGDRRCRRRCRPSSKTRWLELFKYPRLVAAGCLTGLTQTGGASLGLWGATLLVIVLNTTPAHAAFLMIWVGLVGNRRPVLHHRADRAAGPPRRRNPGLRDGGAADGVGRLFLQRLYRRLVGVLHAAGRAEPFSAARSTRSSGLI